MTEKGRSLTEVTTQAIELLFRELGTTDTLRFVNQFTTGFGDYIAERETRFGETSLEEILTQIKGPKPDKTA